MAENNKKYRGMKFERILLLATVLPMLISIVILSVMLTRDMRQHIKDGVFNELRVSAYQVNEYFVYDVIANGCVDYEEYEDHEYIESLQDLGIELTLFQGDTRFLTSLKNEAGEYIEGTQAAPEIYAKVSGGEAYTAEDVIINGEHYFVFYSPIYDGEGKFWGMAFAGERAEKVTRVINIAVRKVGILSIVLIVLSVLGAIIVGKNLGKKVTQVAEGINVLADGRLDAEFRTECIISEISQLAVSGEVLQQQLKVSVGGAKETAADLGTVVQNVDNLLIDSAEGTTTIRQAVNELADSAQSMAMTVQDANQMMVDVGESIDRITENIDRMHVSTEESLEANRTAANYMEKLENASERTTVTADEIGRKIAECSEAAEKIKSATVAITEISSQTNLLSLNASIEAARAGEAGRGFAVVASEIQKLAEQSSSSATDIQDVIDEILSKVAECVNKAGEMNDVIEEQTRFMEETKLKIADMSKAGMAMADGTSSIENEAHQLTQLKENVISSITDLSAISEENAATATQVSTSVEGVSVAVESTKKESNTMRSLAQELDAKMSFFKA